MNFSDLIMAASQDKTPKMQPSSCRRQSVTVNESYCNFPFPMKRKNPTHATPFYALSKRSPPCHIITEESPENYPRSCIWNNDTHIVSQEEAQHNKLKWDTMKKEKKRFSPLRAFRFLSPPVWARSIRTRGIGPDCTEKRKKPLNEQRRSDSTTAASTEKKQVVVLCVGKLFSHSP